MWDSSHLKHLLHCGTLAFLLRNSQHRKESPEEVTLGISFISTQVILTYFGTVTLAYTRQHCKKDGLKEDVEVAGSENFLRRVTFCLWRFLLGRATSASLVLIWSTRPGKTEGSKVGEYITVVVSSFSW